MQRNDVRSHQTQQDQRNSNHVKGEEAVQCGVADHVVAANQQRQIGTYEGNRGKQIDDHLSAPVAHLAPWQQVAHKGFGHQAQKNGAAKNPDQFARFAVAAIDQAAEHVHVHNDEESRSTGGVHVANQPAPGHVAHDVLDRTKSQCCIRLVVHRQKNAGGDLNHQHQQRQRAEDVPEVEIFRRVVFTQVLFVELAGRKTVVQPVQRLGGDRCVGRNFFEFSHN